MPETIHKCMECEEKFSSLIHGLCPYCKSTKITYEIHYELYEVEYLFKELDKIKKKYIGILSKDDIKQN